MLLPCVHRAKSMIVVVPPNNAARLTTAGGSVSPGGPSGAGIGHAQCTWGSMPPGITILPVASINRAPSGNGRLPGVVTDAIFPSATWIS